MSDKRLIEEEFPLKEVSLDSIHEKSVRHGHISTLHIWPARRPLAASRAAVIEALLPSPENSDQRHSLVTRIGGEIKQKILENSIKEETEGSITRWLGTPPKNGKKALQDHKKAVEFREKELLFFREEIYKAHGGHAPRILDTFSGGGAIPFEAMRLGCETFAMDINPVACFILAATLDYPQKLAGKTHPLPDFALRDQAFMEKFFNANPQADPQKVAGLLGEEQKSTIEADLAWQVRAWGEHILALARKELSRFYPTYAEFEPLDKLLAPKYEKREPILVPLAEDGTSDINILNAEFPANYLKDENNARWIEKPTVAYLWARTCRCTSCSAEIPLLKTKWLCKKVNNRVLLKVTPNDDKSGVIFEVQEDVPKPSGTSKQRTEIDNKLGQGTMSRVGVTCPCCGATMSMDDIRSEGKAGRLGLIPTAVIYEQTTTDGKRYRLPTEKEIECAKKAIDDVEQVYADIPFGIPKEPTPNENALGMRIPKYGFSRWCDIFTPRQLLALGVFCRLIRKAMTECLDMGYPREWAEAIGVYLAIVMDKLANYNSAICTWNNQYEKIRATFARFALPITWDIIETCAINEVGAAFTAQLEWVARFLDENRTTFNAPTPIIINQSCIQKLPENLDCIITDPPYYDAIPYSDCMDFFYIWLRRITTGTILDKGFFKEPLGPKWNHETNDGELIDDPSRHGGDRTASKKAYEEGMAKVFKRCAEALVEDGRLVIVFANKQADAWETMVSAIIKAGFQVTASWPIATEMLNRPRALGSASLSTSVWLVCRKRGFARPGWDNKVLADMRSNIEKSMERFWDAGVRGPDFVWAATGPALASYSAYPMVKKADSSDAFTVAEFLAEVRRIVVKFVVGRVLKGKDTSGLDQITSYYLLHRNDYGLGDAPAGACIMYAVACGTTDTELSSVWNLLKTSKGKATSDDESEDETEVETSSAGKLRLLNWKERKHPSLGIEGRAGREVPLIDRIHKLMQLYSDGDQRKVDEFLDAYALRRNEQFLYIIQALVELSEGEERTLLESISNHIQNRGIQLEDQTKQGELV